MNTIGADHPACANGFCSRLDNALFHTEDLGCPAKLNTKLRRTTMQQVMKQDAPYTVSYSLREVSGYRFIPFNEADSLEDAGLDSIERNSPTSQALRQLSGIIPSPQALSIGGLKQSATVTASPCCLAAMAVAKPAGPPPQINTSVSYMFSRDFKPGFDP